MPICPSSSAAASEVSTGISADTRRDDGFCGPTGEAAEGCVSPLSPNGSIGVRPERSRAAANFVFAAENHQPASPRSKTRVPTIGWNAATPESKNMIAYREVAFIDPGISDLPSLLSGLRPDIDAIVLPEAGDAVAEIATRLQGRSDLSAVHIIAHGQPGEVRFAAGSLSLETLSDRAADVAEIGDALGADGEILLWCCNTGEGRIGAAFIDALARTTGARVSAASGRIGAAVQGGSWGLDRERGHDAGTGAAHRTWSSYLRGCDDDFHRHSGHDEQTRPQDTLTGFTGAQYLICRRQPAIPFNSGSGLHDGRRQRQRHDQLSNW